MARFPFSAAPSTSAVEPLAVSVEDAAIALGVGKQTLYNNISSGQFPIRTVRLGGRVLIPLAALRAFLEADWATATPARGRSQPSEPSVGDKPRRGRPIRSQVNREAGPLVGGQQ